MADKVNPMHAILMTLTFIFVLTTAGQAQDFTGWCIDMGEPGCQDQYIPFYENKIDWCEQSCSLSNRVKVKNIIATLYDYTCKSDYGGTAKDRAINITHSVFDDVGTEVDKHSLIRSYETLPIFQCP